MRRSVRPFILALAIFCTITNAISPTVTAASPSREITSVLVSSRKPDGLILSNGNLYFTSHDAAGAAVWRMAQTEAPGQERILYWEAGAVFGDIIFAQVNGNFFGYFFAQSGGVVTIKRVSLTGGNATVLGSVGNSIDIVNTHHNLVTDGVNLYWQDVSAVRKMPIGGGPITVLDNSSPNTPGAGIGLQGSNIVYAFARDIRFVPTSGATTSPDVRTIATADSRVSALYPVSNGVYWGEQNGLVRLKVGATTISLISAPELLATSISANSATAGGDQAWTQCNNTQCQLFFAIPHSIFSYPIGNNALGVTVTPSGEVFWGDDAGVHRGTLQ